MSADLHSVPLLSEPNSTAKLLVLRVPDAAAIAPIDAHLSTTEILIPGIVRECVLSGARPPEQLA
jgi:hypothetical protein